jgi:thiol-disulfide isomerase/thioredoxin
MQIRFLLLILSILFSTGCQDKQPNAPTQKGVQKMVQNNAEPVLISADNFKKKLESHKGKFIFLNLWATWCPPCVEELPDLARFAAQHPEIAVVALSFDDPKDQANVRAFLDKKKINLPALILDSTNPDADLKFLDPALPQEIPVTYIINPDGSPLRRLVGSYNFQEFNELLDAAKETTK